MSKKVEISREVEFDIGDYELNETDKNVFKLLTQHPELKQGNLAKLLNISADQFSRIKLKPAFQKAYNDFKNEEAKSWIQVIIDARKKASQKLVQHIDSSNPFVSIRATENILQLDKLDLSDDQPEEPPY